MAFATKPKPAPTHKKRSGKHRKHNDQYLKHYWPYLPLLSIVAVGLLCSMLWPKGMDVLGAQTDLSASSLLSQTNQQRAQYDESALTQSDALDRAATAKAQNMVSTNYWSHNAPDGKTPWSFISAAGYNYAKAGENLAYGLTDAQSAVTAWMNSPEHRANILDTGYSEVGFGVATSKDFVGHGPETVIVAMYGSPAGAAAPAYVASSSPAAVKGAQAPTRAVSRVSVLQGGQSGNELTILYIGAMALATMLFVSRHVRLLHKSLVRGEAFVLHHPMLDTMLVVVITVGFVLTRSAGFIL